MYLTIQAGDIASFRNYLQREERSSSTIENYLRHIRMFSAWLDGAPATKEAASDWKEFLVAKAYRSSTINAMLCSLNRFFAFAGCPEHQVKLLRVQKQLFRDDSRELTRAEYDHLVSEAHRAGKERLALLMESICATGIRVSEVRYLTVEAVRSGRAEISMKGKIRTILLPGKLRRKLQQYARARKITSGEIFLTRGGKGLSRKQIWAEMKALCHRAGVAPTKVFPHNLRHLFARTFYKVCRDVAKLADILGHTSIETTRIYLISTGAEHARILEQLKLISYQAKLSFCLKFRGAEPDIEFILTHILHSLQVRIEKWPHRDKTDRFPKQSVSVFAFENCPFGRFFFF